MFVALTCAQQWATHDDRECWPSIGGIKHEVIVPDEAFWVLMGPMVPLPRDYDPYRQGGLT